MSWYAIICYDNIIEHSYSLSSELVAQKTIYSNLTKKNFRSSPLNSLAKKNLFVCKLFFYRNVLKFEKECKAS